MSAFINPVAAEDGTAIESPTIVREPAAASRRVDASATISPASLVSNTDRLRINFQGHADLNGEYSIAGDETLSLPIIGRLDVKGLSLAGLEKTLVDEMRRSTGRETVVTVDVVDYREVFVSGYVSKPGAHRWKRGVTVLHAEALSGGLFRATASNGSTMVTDAEQTRARRAAADLARLNVLQARLSAELAGEKEIQKVEQAYKLVGEREANALMAAQRTLLTSRAAAFDSRAATLRRVHEVSAEELQVDTQQRARIAAATKKRAARLVSLQGLLKRGVITEDRLLAEEAQLMDLETRASSLVVSMAKLNATVIGAKRDLDELVAERKATTELELQNVEREMAQLEIEVDSASKSYRLLTGADPLDSAQSSGVFTPSYRIVRTENGVSRSFVVDQSTELFPGDVLVVEQMPMKWAMKNGG